MTTRTWMCHHCSKMVEMEVSTDEPECVYDKPIPEGWVWYKYKSIKLPNTDTGVLGCCEEHAREGAKRFEIPEWAQES